MIQFDRVLGSVLRLAQRAVNAHALLSGNYEAQITEIIGKVRPHTMTSPARLAALCDAISHVVRYRIAGDFVECGVWKGGSSMAAALRLIQLGDFTRDLYLFDTFEGMTQPAAVDRSRTSGFAAATMLKAALPGSKLLARAALDEVQANMTATGYPQHLMHFVQGAVEETLPAGAPEEIAVLRLDTDWYSSTKHELAHLFPRLSKGGILIIDDYGDWEGARKAVDEFFAEMEIPVFLHRIDHTGRITVKP